MAAAAAGLLAAAPPSGTPLPFPAVGRAFAQVAAPADGDRIGRLVNQNLQQDRETLLAGRTQAEQEEAARRLVARQSPAARSYLLEALQATGRPRAQLAQLAAAKALADDPSPDPQAIDPLAALLGGERLTEAATAALLNERTDAALEKVFSFVNREPAAASTIRALGASTDRRVAAKLVELVQNNDVNVIKRNYAADALVEMTGLTDNGRNPAAWGAWWRANAGKPADQFRAELLERNRRRRPAALADVEPLVTDLYRLAADKDKPAALQRVLTSADAPFRAAGAKLTYAVFRDTGQVPQGAVPRVRELLRDSSPEVRLEAARTLQNLNDKPSLDAVLAQLRVEPDAEVRLALMQAVVPMQDPRAAPELIRLLDDPSVRTATVAAETLAKIGPAIGTDARQAADTVTALTNTIANAKRAAQDPAGDLRGACVEALVPLRDAKQSDLYGRLMGDRAQPARVRKAALAAVGELGNKGAAQAVVNIALDEREPPDVRVAALGTMERLADPGFAAVLFTLSRQPNADPQVRRAAAKAIEALLPQVNDDQLDRWASQLRKDGDFAALIPVQGQVVKRAEAAQRPPTELAAVWQSLGDAYVRAGRAREGIDYIQRALNAYVALKRGQPPAAAQAFDRNITGLRREVLGGYLAAEQYTEAVAFARQAVEAGESQAELLPLIGNELDRLNKERQSDKAQRLATEALKFNRLDPSLQKWFKDNLEAARQTGPGGGPGPR